jgi:hypothetical protein
VYVLRGVGDPNVTSNLPPTSNVGTIALGSLWLRTDAPDSTHALYVKTAQPNTWTAK